MKKPIKYLLIDKISINNKYNIQQVFLGDQHQCTCNAFQRDRELCKHLCWLLLKRFRIPRTNPSKNFSRKLNQNYVCINLVLWQKGLVEREINELLRGLIRDDNERNKSNQNRKSKVIG